MCKRMQHHEINMTDFALVNSYHTNLLAYTEYIGINLLNKTCGLIFAELDCISYNV